MAIAVGWLVSFAVRRFGQGYERKFAIVGAACALLGCVLGNLMTNYVYLAQYEGVSLLEILPFITLGISYQIMVMTFSAMDLVFYGIAVFEGYRYSLRPAPIVDHYFEQPGGSSIPAETPLLTEAAGPDLMAAADPTVPEPTEKLSETKPKKTGLAAFWAVAVMILLKFKYLLVLLKFSKFGATAITMLVTIGVYAMAFGFWYGLGFVLLLLVHELGHYFVAKKVQLDVSAPIFIPFIGAFINMKEQPKDALVEAKVGYGGPLLGTLAALVMLAVYWLTGSKLAAALAYTGFLLNLFNLIPVHPMDGGRIVTAISPYLWLAGFPILLFLIYKSFNVILVLITVLGAFQAYKTWKNRDYPYYDLPAGVKTNFALLYFGLIAILGTGIWYTMGIAACPSELSGSGTIYASWEYIGGK